MRTVVTLLALALASLVAAKEPPTFRPKDGRELQALLAAPHPEGANVLLRPGRYVLVPSQFDDATCGNCEDPATPVPATRGLQVSGCCVRISGTTPSEAILDTRSGYGVVFDGCSSCVLEHVTVTGGVRDPDGRATDAGIVVRSSSVTVRDCVVRDNIGDPQVIAGTIVGIAGIAGREGAELTVENCRIMRNSWDGVALYRGARATIRDNVVDGVDLARGAAVGGGRGVGIGMTWDAQAVVEGNLVRRYWKGIGVFVDAQATVRRNVVEDVATWGIALWDAGKGAPRAEIVENVVFHSGACGASITADPLRAPAAPGRFSGNVLVSTGQDPKYDSGEPYCRQEALARHAVPPAFVIGANVFADNREPGGAPGRSDEPMASARQGAAGLLRDLRAQPATASSRFLREVAR